MAQHEGDLGGAGRGRVEHAAEQQRQHASSQAAIETDDMTVLGVIHGPGLDWTSAMRLSIQPAS